MSCGSSFLRAMAASSTFPRLMEDLVHQALLSTLAASTLWKALLRQPLLEFADSGVRINVVAPGPIETGMLNRLA